MPTVQEVGLATLDVLDALRVLGGPPVLELRTPFANEPVVLLCENLLPSGSFKFRPAVAVLAHARREGITSVVAASSGNMGIALAYLGPSYGVDVSIVLPRSCPEVKFSQMQDFGAHVERCEGEYEDSAVPRSQRLARELGAYWVSPDNNPWVIAGAGSIVTDIAAIPSESLDVYSPFVGAGSLAGMNRTYQLLSRVADRKIPRAAFWAVFAAPSSGRWQVGLGNRSLWKPGEAASALDVFAGDVEEGSPAYGYLSESYELTVPASYIEIEDAITWAYRTYEMPLEATAAAALAVALRRPSGRNRTKVAVLSGGNIEPAILEDVVRRTEARWEAGDRPKWQEYNLQRALDATAEALLPPLQL